MSRSLSIGFAADRWQPIERPIAVAFLVLLSVYGVGTALETVAPVVHSAGVIGIHLAVLFGLALPTLVVARTTPFVGAPGERPGRLAIALSLALTCVFGGIILEVSFVPQLVAVGAVCGVALSVLVSVRPNT